jgi:hypothetical protein
MKTLTIVYTVTDERTFQAHGNLFRWPDAHGLHVQTIATGDRVQLVDDILEKYPGNQTL